MSSPTSAEFPLPTALQEGFWQWDKMHCPRPQTPLTEEIFLTGVSRGFSDAMNDYACPVGMTYQVANYYAYSTVQPQDLGDEPFEARLGRYQQAMDELLPKMGDLWANEWLPSIQPGLERALDTDYGALDDNALLAELEGMRQEFYERYVAHGRINFVTLSASLYADAYNEALSPADPTEPYHTLQGYPTLSLSMRAASSGRCGRPSCRSRGFASSSRRATRRRSSARSKNFRRAGGSCPSSERSSTTSVGAPTCSSSPIRLGAKTRRSR